MGWRRTRDTERLTEWERSDGNATIRLRERPDGTWVVRLDLLYQSPDGPHYQRRDAASEAAARDVVSAWRTEFDAE